MITAECNPILLKATTDVLESMCFLGVVGRADVPLDANRECLAVSLQVCGQSTGTFGLSTSFDTARMLASNFLGEEESAIDRSGAEEVLCELANMMCGYFLGLREGKNTYDLSQPRPLPQLPHRQESTVFECFELQQGWLCVWVNLEPTL